LNQNNAALKKIQSIFSDEKYNNAWIIAMDEVGRGPLFGPVTIGGILFKASELFSLELPEWSKKVQDSKKVKPVLRKELSRFIKNCYINHISHVSVQYIEKYNINRAIQYGVYRTACALLEKGFSRYNKISVPCILLDGNYKFHFPQIRMTRVIPEIQSIIRGDEYIFHISCASILAKEERDRLMIQSARRFSGYGLEKNAGYGTLHHRDAIKTLGITRFHRKHFLKNILAE